MRTTAKQTQAQQRESQKVHHKYESNNNTSYEEKEKNKKKCSIFWRDYDLLHLSQLPQHLCHNCYIQNGYRPTMTTIKALKSVFHFHNGTTNHFSFFS
jgi:hypothetical protein